MNHRFRQVSGQFVDLGSKAKMPSASVVLTAYCRRRQYAVNRRGRPGGSCGLNPRGNRCAQRPKKIDALRCDFLSLQENLEELLAKEVLQRREVQVFGGGVNRRRLG